MIVRLLRAYAPRGFLLAFVSLPVLALACSDDDGTGPTEEMRGFCEALFASEGFSCCSEADKNERQFAVRNRYQSAADCASQLALGAVEGRRAFDPAQAQSCLAHIKSRACGSAPTAAARKAEEEAGCGRVMTGLQGEGQSCVFHDDCKPGLVCPPLRETGGLSLCAKPAPINQVCIGSLPKNSVDHPPCEPNLLCQFTSEAPACLAPPCLIFQCVPFGQENDPCTGNDCGPGLRCDPSTNPQEPTPTCKKVEGPSKAGEACRSYEQCADGLYCDLATGTCAPKKAEGEPCVSPLNTLLECKGFCRGEGQSGVCVSFCGSG